MPNMNDFMSELRGVKKWKSLVPSTTDLHNWFNEIVKYTITGPIKRRNSMFIKYLKVKIKSLAVEAQIIRSEEHKSKARYHYLRDKQGLEEIYHNEINTFWGLRNHRTNEVRNEARAAQHAYGFVRGKSFKYVEANTIAASWIKLPKEGPQLVNEELKALSSRVARLATKYGSKEVSAEDIQKWYIAGFTKEDHEKQVQNWQAHVKKVAARIEARRARKEAKGII